MSLRQTPSLTEAEARLLNPLKLAYLGDSVWELLVGDWLIAQGFNVRHMHREAVASVNAKAQAMSLERIGGLLTESETDIVRRGRNAHPHHAAPQNQELADYQAATALEALMGYLYLTGQEDRIRQLFAASRTEDEACRK
ncbi:MAG: Mini-ribonuclease 3 [Aristaeellaceae bacterium]